MIKTFIVDDEPLALERLRRMLQATGRVEIAGACSDPVEAVEQIRWSRPQLLFLDIHMPELTGFELLGELEQQPLVVFTTAYDQHALEAFQVNSIDYLMKPIEPAHLDRALAKAERLFAQAGPAARLPICARCWRSWDRSAVAPAMDRAHRFTHGRQAGVGGSVSRDALLRQR